MQKITKPQKALRHHLFFALFAMLMAGLALAGPKEDTKAAYERKDYKLVVKIVNPLAIEGEAWAQNWLAGAYIFGQGVVQDLPEAAKWYRLAAEQGDAAAQNNLAFMYDTGKGVKQDYAEAAKWYQLAAQQGSASAQSNLGVMYANGQGVVQDHAEAAKWYRLAAEQGDAAAQMNLGYQYSKGQGVVQDHVKAYSWYHLSTANGFTGAVKNRDILAKKMTPQQIADAQKLARDCQARQFKGCY